MVKMIVIGASAGGVETLQLLFACFKNPLPVPVVTVLHVHPDTRSIITMFQSIPNQSVVEAEDGQRGVGGKIYMAPSDYHLYIESDGSFSLCASEKINHVRPAVDPLFYSAADYATDSLIGVVLTGSHNDGSQGLAYIQNRGGMAMVQDPSSAEVDGMPTEAIRSTNTKHVYSIPQLAEVIGKHVHGFL